MKKSTYFNLILLVTFSLLQFNVSALAAGELKTQGLPLSQEQKTILKGTVRQDVSHAKPLTGIGVIGLRFIHQSGFPSFIEEVYSNSPASRAGLKSRDLIFAIDGVRTDHLTSDGVYQLLSGDPGTKVKIFITRGQSMFNVDLVREDLANFSLEVQNRYLSGPITVPINPKDFFPYH